MRYLIVLPVMALAACAYSPAELIEAGMKLDFTSTATAREVTHCIARNTEDFRSGPGNRYIASVREGRAPGSFEVVITLPGAQGAMAYALIEPSSSGARGTIWQFPHALEHMRAELVKGCAAT